LISLVWISHLPLPHIFSFIFSFTYGWLRSRFHVHVYIRSSRFGLDGRSGRDCCHVWLWTRYVLYTATYVIYIFRFAVYLSVTFSFLALFPFCRFGHVTVRLNVPSFSVRLPVWFFYLSRLVLVFLILFHFPLTFVTLHLGYTFHSTSRTRRLHVFRDTTRSTFSYLKTSVTRSAFCLHFAHHPHLHSFYISLTFGPSHFLCVTSRRFLHFIVYVRLRYHVYLTTLFTFVVRCSGLLR